MRFAHRSVVVAAALSLAAVAASSLFGPVPTAGPAGAGPQLGRLAGTDDDPPALADPSRPGTVVASGSDMTDAFILVDRGRYYLFTSKDRPDANVPVRSGTTVGQWGPVTDALPDPPRWADPGYMWAPDVQRFGNHYLLYFTSRIDSTTDMCIGDAYSTAPAGPYLAAPTPLVCQQSEGGSIDPRTFVDANGTPYLLWKSDNNHVAGDGDTHIYSQQLSPDGLSLVGVPHVVFGPDEPWQSGIVEAPQLVLARGTYWLFYSGSGYASPDYAIGVARCAGPLGPCVDARSTPFLATDAQGTGPGEESVFSDGNGIFMLYAPYYYLMGDPWPRFVEMARLGFTPEGPYLAAP